MGKGMTDERYSALMNDQSLCLTDEELAEGWHWCHEFDGLLVGPGMSEEQFCHDDCGRIADADLTPDQILARNQRKLTAEKATEKAALDFYF